MRERQPVHLHDNIYKVINICIDKILLCVLFFHKGVVYINMTLKVKTIFVFFLWISSVSVQSESNRQTNVIPRAIPKQ